MIRTATTGILGLLILFLSATRTHSSEDSLVVAVDDGYPPYMYGTRESAKGLYPRQIRAVVSRIDIDVEVQALPWKRALTAGQQATMAVGGEVYDFSDAIPERQSAEMDDRNAEFQPAEVRLRPATATRVNGL